MGDTPSFSLRSYNHLGVYPLPPFTSVQDLQKSNVMKDCQRRYVSFHYSAWSFHSFQTVYTVSILEFFVECLLNSYWFGNLLIINLWSFSYFVYWSRVCLDVQNKTNGPCILTDYGGNCFGCFLGRMFFCAVKMLSHLMWFLIFNRLEWTKNK